MRRRFLHVKQPEPLDPEIKKLVCKACWSTVFSSAAFHPAWEAALEPEPTSQANSVGFTYTTPSWSQMQDSIEHMCEWCDLVREEIVFGYYHKTKTKNSPPPAATFTLTLRFIRNSHGLLFFQLAVENDWRALFIVHATPDTAAARYISERSAVSEMDSDLSYELILGYIDECSRHERCPLPASTTLPNRIVDCSDLVRPRLLITDSSARERYMAVSYVWGEEQPHRMTAAKLSSYTNFIDPQHVPRTICDAIVVTHKLGLRYLWVDALCIVQDSSEDKDREIPKIYSNFHNAYLTIIAAQAEKASEGFLRR